MPVRLIKSAIGAGVRRLVYGSTIGVYGSAPTGELSETSPARPENIYAVTKLEVEQVILEHAAQLERSRQSERPPARIDRRSIIAPEPHARRVLTPQPRLPAAIRRSEPLPEPTADR